MKNTHRQSIVVLLMMLALGSLLTAQPKRTDAIWARTAPAGSLTIDGKLDEPAWAKAESIYVEYGKIAGIPGSGYTAETGVPKDPTRAWVKFLVSNNQLYLGITVQDSSIGGANLSPDNFGAADAVIFNVRDKSNPAQRPSPSGEFLYGWIKAAWMNTETNVTAVGSLPSTGPAGKYSKLRFEAATTVKGTANDDSKPDTSYTMEMRVNLDSLGYATNSTKGDIVMFNLAIRDIDWYWPIQDWLTFSRTWIQGPWANVADKDHLRIHARPDVTISSGPVPVIKPEITIPDGKNFAPPVIDGKLDEAVWKINPGFEIKWGDSTIRNAYPSTGPFRSGQFQPTVNGGTANILDPADAIVKMFFKADTLYVGIDVRDRFVQFNTSYDRWDGVILTICDRLKQNDLDHDLLTRKLTVQVDSAKGNPTKLQDYFPILRDSLKGAKVVLGLNSGTIVDTIGVKADSGYQIEMALDLTKLGYPAGRGDGIAFLGLDLLDGDSFIPATNSYGTRTWWFRENDGSDGPAFCYMDPTAVLTSVAAGRTVEMPTEFGLLGNYPNPFNPSTSIRFVMPQSGGVVMTVFDMLGRSIASMPLGSFTAGEHAYVFNASNLSSGVYLYQLRMTGASSGTAYSTPYGKMTLVK
jgi:hypothetical protein